MTSKSSNDPAVEAYMASFPSEVQDALREVRAAILEAAPDAEERISYGIVGYFRDGAVIYLAGYRQHIGLYPAPHGPEFAEAFARYGSGKSTLRFPLKEPMPLALVTQIVRFRVAENASAAAARAKKRR
jgi:uncharacterized protein YdhG (YjbR/CyaY superfamily)